MKQRKIVLSKTAKNNLTHLLDYLESNWPKKVKNDFIKKLDISLLRISHYPHSCPESTEVKGLFKCVVTKQNTLLYRINSSEIEVVTIFDSRQDPSKIKDQIG
jgi:plasmid stabilization system protein ParE